MTPYPSEPIDVAAIKKLAPVDENFRIFYYEAVGAGKDSLIRVRGCIMRPSTRGPRKGELVIPVSGTERECFLTRADTGKEPAAREVFAIRHIPTGEYMPNKMSRAGAGGWSSWIPGPVLDGYGGCDGYDKNPRIFFSLRSARNALTAWLMGVHSRSTGITDQGWDTEDHYDEHIIEAPPVPRVRAEMEIVPLQLAGLK